MKANKRQARPPQYIFVLWGDQFDEAAAVLAITQLREAGHCVKVVGLNGACVKGAHGLGLLADLTLDQALPLADQAIGVVIPCTITGLARVENDPRVGAFLRKVRGYGVRVIVGLQPSSTKHFHEIVSTILDSEAIPQGKKSNL